MNLTKLRHTSGSFAAAALALVAAACSGGGGTPGAGLKGVCVAGEGSLWVDGAHREIEPHHDGERERRRPCMESMSVSGGDVYLAGWEVFGPIFAATDLAVLWKNGEYRYLGGGGAGARAHSVFVAGGDVYVAGEEYTESGAPRATLWVNGEARRLPGAPDADVRASAVHVADGDVYVVGNPVDNIYHAVLWKNGVPQRLETGGWYPDVASVFAAGGDVYAAGSDWIDIYEPRAVLWKNGRAEFLQDMAEASSVFVHGGDVYVAGVAWPDGGWDRSVGVVWKNGAVLHCLGDGAAVTIATGLFVSGGGTYVVGYQVGGHGAVPMLWKNGEAMHLLPEDPRADIIPYSVFVAGGEQ